MDIMSIRTLVVVLIALAILAALAARIAFSEQANKTGLVLSAISAAMVLSSAFMADYTMQ